MKKTFFITIAFALFTQIAFAQQDSIYYRAKVWDKKNSSFLEEDKKTEPSKENLVLFIGSSSFTRWDNIEKCFPESNVLNRGFGGSHASDLLYYAEQIVFPYNPSQIVIYEGDNDIGSKVTTVDEYLTDLKALVRLIEIRLPDVPVIVLSIKKCPKRDFARQLYEEANVKLYEYSLSKPQVTFLDVSSVLLDNMGEYKAELFAEDNVHITADAYKLWADIIRPHLLKK